MIYLSGNELTGTLPSELLGNLRAMIDKPKHGLSNILQDGDEVYASDIQDYHTSVKVTIKRLDLELTKIIDIFVSMDLSNNQFFGQIPEEVGQLISLQMLNLSHNNFTGPIPASFGNLAALESLDLSSNKLGGRIPSQMTKLTFLSVLNLSKNNFVGPIPHGNQFGTFENDSYIGNLGLCGLPLSKQCNNHGEAEPPAQSVVEEEDSQVPFWQVEMMGYGSGVVLGMSLGYIVFTTGKPWCLISSTVPPPSSHLCLPHQRAALLQFKSSIFLTEYCSSGDDYNNDYAKTESWNKSIDCCSWEGVKCDELTGHQPLSPSQPSMAPLLRTPAACFTFMDSDDSTSVTTISMALSRQSYLLNCVDLSGVALTSFLNLTSSLEHLSLSWCLLHGEFPSRIFQLPNLKHIDITGNENIRGYLPRTNWSSGLEWLHLSYCGGFRGSIPASFGNLTRIVSINLSGNRLQGQIPDVFGNLTKLTSLRFSSCNLSGSLPITMFTLPSLLDLDLSYNKLAGPMDLIRMPSSIQQLDLTSNDFHGPLPDSIFDLVNLIELRLSSNNLSGIIEPVMLSKLTSLEVLDLSNNRLVSLCARCNDANYSFPRLATVSFSSCSVSRFPSFFRASQLLDLDISSNMISGGISKWEAEGWEELKGLNLSDHNGASSWEEIGCTLPSFELSSRVNSESSNPRSNAVASVLNFKE
ncbi:receptor-like protein 34 [Hibiscus syriacus]|uniref:receptor-like protein 34 n=1 Tax=Hibiscus syriacus TaxID=106335 RepID=UPI001921E71B|nr:receptor-like protein 34 [Hibiscus syriacus]